MVVQAGDVAYPGLASVSGVTSDDPICQLGGVALSFPIDFKTYNVSAMQLVYGSFNNIMQRIPAFNNSIILLEGYSVQAVQAVPEQTTSYAHRSDRLLVYVVSHPSLLCVMYC